MSREIALKLNAEVRTAMAKPNVLEKLAEAIEPGNLDPDGFTQFIRDEILLNPGRPQGQRIPPSEVSEVMQIDIAPLD